jgi:hypothetical protein
MFFRVFRAPRTGIVKVQLAPGNQLFWKVGGATVNPALITLRARLAAWSKRFAATTAKPFYRVPHMQCPDFEVQFF